MTPNHPRRSYGAIRTVTFGTLMEETVENPSISRSNGNLEEQKTVGVLNGWSAGGALLLRYAYRADEGSDMDFFADIILKRPVENQAHIVSLVPQRRSSVAPQISPLIAPFPDSCSSSRNYQLTRNLAARMRLPFERM